MYYIKQSIACWRYDNKMRGHESTYPSYCYSLLYWFLWFNWVSSCHHFNKQYAEGVHITLFSKLISPQIIRIQVTSCSFNLSRDVTYSRIFFWHSSKSKVCHFGSELLCNEYVWRFYISVYYRRICWFLANKVQICFYNS